MYRKANSHTLGRWLTLVAACTPLLACGPTERDGRARWSDGFVDITAADSRTCAVQGDGTVRCWGEGVTTSPPARTSPGDGRFVRAGAHGECTYALTDAAELRLVSSGTRCPVPPAGRQIDFSVGSPTCAIADGGVMRCWSPTPATQTCVVQPGGELRCSPVRPAPPLEPFPGERFRRVAVGSPSCAIQTDGALRCWPVCPTDAPCSGRGRPPAADARRDWVDVAIGKDFVCALDRPGAVSCWGPGAAPLVPPPAARFSRLAARDGHICGVETGGALRCWGAPFSWYSWTYPPPEGVFVDVSVGAGHACARKANGDAACWGVNRQGQVTGTPISRFFRN